MNADTIQTRLDALCSAMLAKGKVKPHTNVRFESGREPSVSVHWEDMTKPAHSYRTVGEWFRKGDLAQQFDDAAAFIAAMPTADEAKMQDFMQALGNVIDMGRANGIDVSYVNPLTETMKRLSENALTHQAA